MAFEEPTILATFDRSYGDKHERLQLEQGEYNGRPTFALRVCWQADDGSWRWSAAKLNDKGRAWQSLNLKARELRELGEALIAAAADAGEQRMGPPRQQRSVKDTPQRQAARDNMKGHVPESTDDLPF